MQKKFLVAFSAVTLFFSANASLQLESGKYLNLSAYSYILQKDLDELDDIELYQEIEIDQVMEELTNIVERAEVLSESQTDLYVDVTDSKGRRKR